MQIKSELIMRSVVDSWQLESLCSSVLNLNDFVTLKTAVYMLFVDGSIWGLRG